MQHGETPVLIATGLGEKEIVQELLENDANPNMVSHSTVSSVHCYLPDSYSCTMFLLTVALYALWHY